ncbi:peptidylprolyl isomerase [Escherichia coli]
MARTADEDSAASQFFVDVADNPFLDHGERDFGYAVFRKMVKRPSTLPIRFFPGTNYISIASVQELCRQNRSVSFAAKVLP